MRRASLVSLSFLLLLAGCGGGGMSNGTTTGQSQTLTAGPLTVTAKAGQKPLVQTGVPVLLMSSPCP